MAHHEGSHRLCTIKQVNTRLYPTYSLLARDHRLCGITTWTPNENGSSFKPHLEQSKPKLTRDSSAVYNGIEANSEENIRLKAKINPHSVYLLHVRFPVIKLLRTNEDTYATLICSPSFGDYIRTEQDEKNNQEENLRLNLSEVLQPENTDRYDEQHKSIFERSRAGYNELGDDSNEQIVEESRQHQQQVLALANQTVELNEAEGIISESHPNVTDTSTSASTVIPPSTLPTISISTTAGTIDKSINGSESVSSTPAPIESKSDSRQKAAIFIQRLGIGGAKIINQQHFAGLIEDSRPPIIKSAAIFDGKRSSPSSNATMPTSVQDRHVTVGGRGNSSGKWPSAPLTRGGVGVQKSSFIIDSQLCLFVLAIMLSLIMIALILAIIIDNL